MPGLIRRRRAEALDYSSGAHVAAAMLKNEGRGMQKR